MTNEFIQPILSKYEEATQTQKIIVYINAACHNSQFNLLQFCESRGIDFSNIVFTSRLFQFKEEDLENYWNFCLQNNPNVIESLRNPEILYQAMVSNSDDDLKPFRFLEDFDFSSEEIEDFSKKVSFSMGLLLLQSSKLIQLNLSYLRDLGVKNIKDIFFQYYELFLIDSNSFNGIFNKYDSEDLIDKLIQNIAIVEYL